MTRAQLHRDVAALTGDTPRTVRRLGFGLLAADPGRPDPADIRLVVDCPSCRRPVPYPGRARDGSHALAACDAAGCDLDFDVDPARVYDAGTRGGAPGPHGSDYA